MRFAFLDVLARALRRAQDFDRRDAPAIIEARDQPLRHDVAERLREARAYDLLFVLRVQPDDAVDRLRGIDRVHRRQNEVSGLGGFERDLGRLLVAHLADQDHLRRLAQGGAQGGRKVFGVRADFALVDRRLAVRMQKLDRVFDRDDVVMLAVVDVVDDRGERRGFADAGRTRDEHDAVAQLRDLREVRGQVQAFERRDFRRDHAHHDRICAALLKDVDAKARARRQRVAEVGRAGGRESVRGFGVAVHQGHRDDLGLIRREAT